MSLDDERARVPDGVVLDGLEEDVRRRPTNLTRLVAMAMIDALKTVAGDPHRVPEAFQDGKGLPRLAIFNSGLVRIDGIISPGSLTAYDVHRIIPYRKDPMIRGVRMSGLLVRTLLCLGSLYRGDGRFLQAYDEGGNPLNRGKNASLVNWKREYLVAIDDYLIDGRERGFAFLSWGRSREPSALHEIKPICAALIEYLRKTSMRDITEGDREAQSRSLGLIQGARGTRAAHERLIIVADVDHELRFRIFDRDGNLVMAIGEKLLEKQARQIKDLRKQLEGLWHPQALTSAKRRRVIQAVTSIVDHVDIEFNQEVVTKTIPSVPPLFAPRPQGPFTREPAFFPGPIVPPTSPLLFSELEETMELEADENSRLHLARALILLKPANKSAARCSSRAP